MIKNTRYIETHGFQMSEIEQSDIENIFKGLSNPEVTKYYDVSFSTLEATQEQMDWYYDLKKKGTGVWWKICAKDSGEFCGAAGFNGLNKKHQKAEIGFWLLPEYWGKRIMKEVMPYLFSEGFVTLGLNRIEGFVQSENYKCKQALERVNFQHEGRMRACEMKEGEFIDVDIYAILKENYRTSKDCSLAGSNFQTANYG